MIFDAKQLANLKKNHLKFPTKIIEIYQFCESTVIYDFFSSSTNPKVLAEFVKKLLIEKDSTFKDKQ